MRLRRTLPASAFLFDAHAHAYVWPSPHDALEDSDGLVVSGGFADGALVHGASPCSTTPLGHAGRQAAAEWVRVAYHDMATYNADTGLGGLDASIGFETNRPQNVGAGMDDSLVFFSAFQAKNSSMSDVMAMGVILAIKNCGGPSIPFRAGRIAAEAAGRATVPEPQHDLATHAAEFALQGLNETEMIGRCQRPQGRARRRPPAALVACGHALGGVHEVDFRAQVSGAACSFFAAGATIAPECGISSFFVDWAWAAGQRGTHSDNGGDGFALQDVGLFQPVGSCTGFAARSSAVVALIRNDVSTAHVDSRANARLAGTLSLKQVSARTELVRAARGRVGGPALRHVHRAVCGGRADRLWDPHV